RFPGRGGKSRERALDPGQHLGRHAEVEAIPSEFPDNPRLRSRLARMAQETPAPRAGAQSRSPSPVYGGKLVVRADRPARAGGPRIIRGLQCTLPPTEPGA